MPTYRGKRIARYWLVVVKATKSRGVSACFSHMTSANFAQPRFTSVAGANPAQTYTAGAAPAWWRQGLCQLGTRLARQGLCQPGTQLASKGCPSPGPACAARVEPLKQTINAATDGANRPYKQPATQLFSNQIINRQPRTSPTRSKLPSVPYG